MFIFEYKFQYLIICTSPWLDTIASVFVRSYSDKMLALSPPWQHHVPTLVHASGTGGLLHQSRRVCEVSQMHKWMLWWCLAGASPHAVGAMCWGRRRHARRVYEISQTFEKVFGKGSLNNRVRMVYASWGIENSIQTYFNDTLYWLQSEYGDVNQFLYAISYAQYFGPHSQNEDYSNKNAFNYSTATIPQVMLAYGNASIAGGWSVSKGDATWMTGFAYGISRLCVSHCSTCTFNRVPHPFEGGLWMRCSKTMRFSICYVYV